jgi:hypothetical protein
MIFRLKPIAKDDGCPRPEGRGNLNSWRDRGKMIHRIETI